MTLIIMREPGVYGPFTSDPATWPPAPDGEPDECECCGADCDADEYGGLCGWCWDCGCNPAEDTILCEAW